jgi:hypothetical protein
LGKDECGADDITDIAGAGGGVAQGPPASGEHGEAAFSAAAQRSKEHVVGAVVHGEPAAVKGLFDPAPSSALSSSLRNHTSTRIAWYWQVNARVPGRVPIACRSAASRRAK